MATYCDPLSASQSEDCLYPDPNVLDLRKGSNPAFLAYQANRARFQRVQRINEEIRECDENLKECAFTPNNNEHRIEQQFGDQQLFDERGVPTGLLITERRSHVDYAASRDQGQNLGEERNNRLFRNVQRDDRQCTLYGTRCGIVQNDGTASAQLPTGKYGVETILGTSGGWKSAGQGPSWQTETTKDIQDYRRRRTDAGRPQERNNFPRDRPTLGYEDRR